MTNARLRRRRSMAQTDFFSEIAVDLFAGGGGASTGYELATGRVMDIAINHSRDAILMHKTNHPHTEHYQADVFEVDPKMATRGRPVGFLWASPDCRHFSKAKGAPLVDRKIRGLAWVILRWALDVRPRVIMAENVEEIQTWGPLIPMLDKKTGRPMKYEVNENGKRVLVVSKPGDNIPEDDRAMMPDPERKGETFRAFIGMLTTGVPEDCPALDEACEFLRIVRHGPEARRLIRGLGYDLDHRELVAADYGAPTIRKRWVMVARRDGQPIVWPEPTHSKTGKDGRKKWRSAAEIIDWTLPMYSIFADKQEIKKKYGVNVVRPLADNTQRRCIRGVDKFTIRSGKPFLIQGKFQNEPQDIERPLTTVTSVGAHELCNPLLSPFGAECNHSGDGHLSDMGAPIGTITQKCTMGICGPVFSPVTFSNTNGSVGFPAGMPVHTVTSDGKQVLSAAQLIQYHTEQSEDVRASGLSGPMQTIDSSNRYGMVSASLTEYFGNGVPIDPREPMHTATSKDREALTVPILQPIHAGGYHGRGNSPTEPVNTVTSSGGQCITAAHIVEFKGQDLGQSPDRPLRTITQSAGEFAICRAVLVKYDPSEDVGEWPKIRALLNKYCGYEMADDEIILLLIGGVAYYIRDILLRMLSARELYNAMGFPPDYIIDRDFEGNEYGKTKQVARCGNAVCPPMAEAVIRANYAAAPVHITTMAQFAEIVSA